MTAAADGLLLLTVHLYAASGSAQPGAPTVGGLGRTWTQVGTSVVVDSSGTDRANAFLFVATGASANTGPVTISPPSSMKTAWMLRQVMGADVAGGAAGAIAQFVKTQSASVSSISTTLAAMASPSNMAYGAVGSQSVVTKTWGNGWTRLAELTSLSFTYVGDGYFMGNTQLTQSVTWTTAGRTGAFVVEIKAVPAPPNSGSGAGAVAVSGSAQGTAPAVGGSPASYVSSSRSGLADSLSSTNTCPVPAGAAAGMTALLAVEINLDPSNSPVTVTWPSGFAEVIDNRADVSGNGVQLLIAKKTLTAADTGNYVTTLAATRWNQSNCVLVRDATAISTPGANSAKTGSGTAVADMSLSAAAAPVLIHFQANQSGGSHAPPSGFTERQEGDYITVATYEPGAPGSYTSTGATTSNSIWSAVLLAATGGAGVPQGSGTGAVSVSGTAVGRTTKRGVGTGAVSISGTAAGRTVKRGSGAGAATVSGSAQGTRPTVGPKSGSGSGSVAVTGTASGRTAKRGSGTGAVTVSGSAQGRRDNRGAGTGAVTVTGAAAGRTTKRGVGSGLVTVSGSASGTAPGVGPRSGSGTGSITVSGSASGRTTKRGTGTGTVGVTGTAGGVSIHRGSGTGAVAVTGVASGSAPVVGAKSGSGLGLLTISGSASGSTQKSGSGLGHVVIDGGSIGHTVKSGSGSGLVLIEGFASAAVMGTPARNPGLAIASHRGLALAESRSGGVVPRTYAGNVKVKDRDGTVGT